MNNSQKGFIAPLILALVAILLIGGGVYVYVQKNQANQPVIGNSTATSTANQYVGWSTYTNTQYGYSIKYPNTSSVISLDKDTDRIYVSNIKIGDDVIVRVLSKANIATNPKRCADEKTLTEQVKCNYSVLASNANLISMQKFGDNNFVYADFEALDHPNVKTRTIWAFMEKNSYIYQFEILNPDSAKEALFKDVISTFEFLK